MDKIRIAAVSYINTFPFLYGIEKSNCLNILYELSIETPAICAQKLLENKVDVGLIPIAVIPELKYKNIISDYCIGANGDVKSVVLLSNCKLENIKTIYLDYQSRTSVLLVQVLAKFFWKIKVKWVKSTKGYENKQYNTDEGIVIIGDRSFSEISNYKFKFDLSAEWKKFSGLPFVFAAWVANKNLSANFIDQFNNSLKYGIKHIEESIIFYGNKRYNIDLKEYLEENIKYRLDNKKKQAMELFLDYCTKL